MNVFEGFKDVKTTSVTSSNTVGSKERAGSPMNRRRIAPVEFQETIETRNLTTNELQRFVLLKQLRLVDVQTTYYAQLTSNI